MTKEHYQKYKDYYHHYAVTKRKSRYSEVIKPQKQEYYKTASGIFTLLKSRAKQREKEFLLTRSEFIEWYNLQSQTCVFCSKVLEKKGTAGLCYSSPSIDRKINSLPYRIDNIVLCCYYCNVVKNGYLTYDEMLLLGKSIKQIEDARAL